MFRTCTKWIVPTVVIAACLFTPTLGAAAAVHAEPVQLDRTPAFNWIVTTLFGLAILHTFLAPRFLRIAHRLEHEHRQRLISRGRPAQTAEAAEAVEEVSFRAQLFHFLGEIEVVFGLWVIPLLGALMWFQGWTSAVSYLNSRNFTEPLFVLVIMTIAASRPVLALAQSALFAVASLGGGTVGAWWLAILTIGPILGSFITEPAAMTISALVLSRRFFSRRPSAALAYASIGLLFVNVSIGGTLTHFAAPPVLMVAGKWGWDLPFMATHFGWKAALSIVVSNLLVWLWFRKEFSAMADAAAPADDKHFRRRVPKRLIAIHVLFLGWTVFTNHYPVLFMGGFLFFIGFLQATAHHQDNLSLRSPLLVAFFLAGLVIHGGLQGWWIEPLLARLSEVPLFLGAVVLTAFNDNAAITYLASLVPGLGAELKYAVVAGAVVGGGLTIIANAPNPAGAAILNKHFDGAISPLGLLAGALFPTGIAAIFFLVFR